MEKLLTQGEIRRLNEARTILVTLAKRAQAVARDADENREAFSLGKLHEIAENAEHEVFQVLNTAKSYCAVEIDDEQMHNRAAVVEAVEA